MWCGSKGTWWVHATFVLLHLASPRWNACFQCSQGSGSATLSPRTAREPPHPLPRPLPSLYTGACPSLFRSLRDVRTVSGVRRTLNRPVQSGAAVTGDAGALPSSCRVVFRQSGDGAGGRGGRAASQLYRRACTASLFVPLAATRETGRAVPRDIDSQRSILQPIPAPARNALPSTSELARWFGGQERTKRGRRRDCCGPAGGSGDDLRFFRRRFVLLSLSPQLAAHLLAVSE